MRSIDERIVDMRFDNRQFESGIRESLVSLGNLKRGLDLGTAGKGLLNAVNGIASKFTTLGIIGVTALQNLANAAIVAGQQIMSALTVDPIMEGFREYEVKMGSVQTIMAGTGESLAEVNRYLDELNVYADKTIYTFADMTRNIGKFTNAGVSLKASVKAIQGITNAAALAGANTEEASRSMYNFAQALSQGYVALIDWKSIELANMATKSFKDELIKTAVAAGTLKKTAKKGLYKAPKGTIISATKNFNKSLQEQWMTTDVLVKTLAKYSDETTEIGKRSFAAAQDIKKITQLYDVLKEAAGSGWAKSFELVVGDFGKAKFTLTNVGKVLTGVLDRASDARNEMLKFWEASGGRKDLIDSIGNAVTALKQIITPIKEAFREFFPATTWHDLVNFTDGLKVFTEGLKIGAKTGEDIKRTFRGVFAVLDLGRMAVTSIAGELIKFIKYILPGSNGILDFTGNLGDWLVAVNKAAKAGDVFNKTIEKIKLFLAPVGEGIKYILGGVIDTFRLFGKVDMTGLDTFKQRLLELAKPFSILVKFVTTTVVKTLEILKRVAPLFFKFAGFIGKAVGKLQDVIIKSLDNVEFERVFDIVNGVGFAGILIGLKKFIESLTKLTNNSSGFLGRISGIFDGVRDSLKAYQSQLKANVLMKIAISMAILAASLMALSLIDSKKLTSALGAMTGMFVELFGSMALFQKLMGATGFIAMSKITTAMISLSVAILLLTAALTKLSKLKWEQITNGLYAIGILMGILITSSKLIQGKNPGLIKAAAGFTILAVALNLLAAAVKKLGTINVADLTKGLIGVGVLLGELTIFMKLNTMSKMGIINSVGILILAGALNVLAVAVKKMGSIATEDMIKGLLGVMGVLTTISGFMILTSGSKGMISTAISLTILGVALNILSKALAAFGKMGWEEIGKSMTTLAGSLTLIAAAMYFMPGAIPGALSLVVVAAGLIVLAKALAEFGFMSWEEIGKAMVVLTGGLTLIAAGMYAMSGALPGAAALIIVSAALVILAKAFKSFTDIDLPSLGKGLLALVGVFAILGVSALVLGPVLPVILGLSGALLLLGIGITAVGGGLLLFSAGLAALAVSGVAGAAALTVVLSTLIGTLPLLFKTFAKSILDFIKLIGDGSATISEAFSKIVVALLKSLKATVPELISTLTALLLALLPALDKLVPKFIDSGMKLIMSLLKGVRANAAEITKVVIDILIQMSKAFEEKREILIQAGYDLIISYINALATAMDENTQPLLDAMNKLMKAVRSAGLKVLQNSIKSFFWVFTDIMDSGVVKGIKDSIPNVIEGFMTLITRAINAIRGKNDSFTNIGKDIVRGLIGGIKSMGSEVAKASGSLGITAIKAAKNALASKSPSKKFYKIGGDVVEGFIRGINANKKGSYDAIMDWLDEKKYYNQLSLRDELYVLKKAQKGRIKNADERKNINREVYRVEQELIKEKEELIKAEYDYSTKWIEKKKYYNELTLKEEYAAWTRIQKRYKKGTEERENAERELYRLKGEILQDNKDYLQELLDLEEETTNERKSLDTEYYQNASDLNRQLIEGVQNVTKEYEDALKSRSDAIFASFGLFDKVGKFDENGKEIIETINGSELVENLAGQVKALAVWKNSLEELSNKKILAPELLTELQNMGPSSIESINALTRLNTYELNRYNDLWTKKRTLANEQATTELEGLRIESVNKIKLMTTDTANELEFYKDTWRQKTDELTVTSNAQLDTLKKSWMGKIGEITTETEKKMEEMTYEIGSNMSKTNWTILGSNMIRGITEGMDSEEGILAAQASASATAALEAAKRTLGIKSPSKAFATLGMFAIRGFSQGITKEGPSAKDALVNTLNEMVKFVSGDMDLTPVIRPVLDLSNLKNGFGLDTSSSVRAASNMYTKMDAFTPDVGTSQPAVQTLSQPIVLNNYFSIRNDRDIGKVSNSLNNTLKKYNNAKGVSV